MSIRPAIRAYLAELLQAGQDIDRTDAADQFVAEHADEIAAATADMVRAAVAAEVKALCAERPEDRGQYALLPGIPAAIAIAPGIVRPRERCSWLDLQIGRGERVANIAHAEKALDAYDQSLDVLRPLLAEHPELTIGDVRDQLSGARPDETAADRIMPVMA